MSATDDRLGELRRQLAESTARLSELEAAAIGAMIEAKGDVTALETRKAQARDRIALLQDAIKHLDQQQQIDAQRRMLAQAMEVMAPLTKAMDDSVAKLALPPYVPPEKPVRPEPEVPAKTSRRPWYNGGLPRESRWNDRAR
jgi:hypothetical protein